jgi:hypothetical protein
MEPWVAADAHNGGMEVKNITLESLDSIDQWSQIRITLIKIKIRIRAHGREKSYLDTHASGKSRIRNLAF